MFLNFFFGQVIYMQNAAFLVNNLYFETNPWSRNAILVVRKENPVERGVCLAESEYWK